MNMDFIFLIEDEPYIFLVFIDPTILLRLGNSYMRLESTGSMNGCAGGMGKHGILIKLKGFLLAWGLRSQRLTWRVRFEGRRYLDELYSRGTPFLLCFWHGKYVPIFPLLEGYEACVISTRSNRGSIIAEICGRFGYKSAQIPDRQGSGALMLMGEALFGARAGGLAVDGPLGPRHGVKIGVILMASEFGFTLLPVSVGIRWEIVLDKRWDRMELPVPFTTICLVFGKPIKVPPKLRKGQVRKWADHLEERITMLDAKAQDMALNI
jgi:lysophospholipid acyltransferase (LPLAT)-like uncharacterized protein